jgi:hypothetical protein
MKRVISFILVMILLAGCVGLVACGTKKGGETETPTSTPTPTPTTTPTSTTTPSGGGLTWNDMPIYSGAGQIQKGSWSIPPAEGDYSKFEWRYYEVKDSLDKVAAFYKSQMPAKGWEEQAWMEVQEVNWGMYNKNDEKDAAMVWVSSQEGKTVIALWRGTK